jgi:RNA polymerase sigma-70 factor (ECF subfamily)
MSSMDEDKELVERTIKGEKEAFEMIIQKYQQPLLNYIGRTVGERELALDFTQEVFIRTYSSIHSYKPQYKFSTWLFKIPIVKKLEISELRERIDKTLEKIPDHLREVFVWRHINEFSYEEMAEIKGIPVGTIKNRVFQARELIRRLLKEKR